MTFELFHPFPAGPHDPRLPDDFQTILARMREAVAEGVPTWGRHPTVIDYAKITSWQIRRLEYGFVTKAFTELEGKAGSALRVLDVGCGVVPFPSWASRRGHDVFALDSEHSGNAALVRGGVNAFYDSRVRYLTGRGEELPFRSESFDVVTCISVMEHLPPGNDRVLMWEVARVLKPDGHLLMTFDVAPPRSRQEGEQAWPPHLRRHGEPYTPLLARRLLLQVAPYFAVSSTDLPDALEALTWDDVGASWRAWQAHNDGPGEVRQYVALGGVLRRDATFRSPNAMELIEAYLEGQAALEERHGFFRMHAGLRLEVIEGLKTALANKESTTESLRERVESLRTTTETLRTTIETLRTTIESRLAKPGPPISVYGVARRILAPRLGELYQQAPRPITIPDRYHRKRSLESYQVISIVTPTLNSARFLDRTLQSVLGQEYPNLEYILQDGASSDDTLVILDRHRQRLAEIESRRDGGQSEALNQGFRRAKGEILAYLNSDDLLLPGALHYVAEYFAENPDVDVVYGHRVLMDAEDREVGRWVLPPHDDRILSWADYVPQETLFWRRRIWEKVGAHFDESFQFAMDWDLLLRFRDAGGRFVRLPRFLGAFRVHANQKTVAQMADVGAKEMARLRERIHGRAIPWNELRRHLAPYLLRHVLHDRLYRLGLVRY